MQEFKPVSSDQLMLLLPSVEDLCVIVLLIYRFFFKLCKKCL